MSTHSPFARNVPIFYCYQFVRGFHFWLPVWFLFLQIEHGLSFTQIGLMEALFGIATMLAEVPTGAIADRYGRRVAMSMGTAGFAVAIVLFGLLSFPLLIIGHVAMSVTRTLLSGSDEAMLYDSLRQMGRTDEYERHVGRARAIATAALLAATVLSGPIVALLGFQAAILLSGVGMGLASLTALLLREPPRREAEFTSQPADYEASISRTPIAHEIRVGLSIVRRQPAVLWMILFGALLMATLDLPDFFIQPLIRSHEVNPADALDRGVVFSALMLPSFFAIVVGSLVAAPLAARLGEGRALPSLTVLGVVCFLPLVIVDHIALVVPLAVLSGATAIVNTLASGSINRRIPSDQRATVLSIYALVTALLLTILIPSSSALVDQFNFRAGFSLAGALLIAGGTICWIGWRRARARETASADN